MVFIASQMRRYWIASLVLTMTGLLFACSPQRQTFVGGSDHDSIYIRPDSVLASDGTVLPVRSWLPEGKPEAVVIALHGFNDYSRAFESTGEYFSENGVILYAYDQRGFGMTPYTGIWANQANLIDDLKQAVRQARRRHPNVPLYILGESMGGAVAVVALTEPGFPEVDGLILVAPAVWGEETMSPLYRSVLWIGAHTLPAYTVTGEGLQIVASNNYPMLLRLSKDPLIIKETRLDAIYGLVHLMDAAYDRVPQLRTPTLLLYGGQDQVIPKAPIENALSRFSSPPTYRFYPDSYHMMLRDIQGRAVMRDILQWMKERASRHSKLSS